MDFINPLDSLPLRLENEMYSLTFSLYFFFPVLQFVFCFPLAWAMSLVSPDVLKYNVVNLVVTLCTIAWGMMPCGTAATKYSTWFLEIPDRIEEPKIKMPTTTKELSLLTARFLFFFSSSFFQKPSWKVILMGINQRTNRIVSSPSTLLPPSHRKPTRLLPSQAKLPMLCERRPWTRRHQNLHARQNRQCIRILTTSPSRSFPHPPCLGPTLVGRYLWLCDACVNTLRLC